MKHQIKLAATAIVSVTLAGMTMYMAMQIHAASERVIYGDARDRIAIIEPFQSEVCPGETLSFPLDLTVEGGHYTLDLRREWCVVDVPGLSNGICLETLTQNNATTVVQRLHIETTASRTVPEVLDRFEPGQWEYRETAEDGHITTYRVFFSVPDTCQEE